MSILLRNSISTLLRKELFPKCRDADFEKEVCIELAGIVINNIEVAKDYVKSRNAAKKRIENAEISQA